MGSRAAVIGFLRFSCVVASVSAGLFATRAQAQATISLYELARFNLAATAQSGSATYIGSNPTAVGWNGSKLYVAGYNASGVTGTGAIIEITNASSVTNGAASGFLSPTYSAVFGSGTFDNTRGYTGLSMKGNTLAASLDAGVNRPTGLQAFNAATNSKLWDLTNNGTSTTGNIGTARLSGGPDFDPGYQGNSAQGSGVGWLILGQGRRFLNNESTGAAIYTTTANNPSGAAQGMILNSGTTGWRDIGFDPATGDLYERSNNLLFKNVRTGSNSVQSTVTLGSLTQLTNTIGQNLGYMNGITSGTFNAFQNTYSGDAIVLNDRAATTAGQSWTNVIKFFTSTGDTITPNWNFLSTPSTSTALYDFEWDSATQTLAVLDFSNRNVSIFSTAVPEPSTWAMLVGGAIACGGAGLRRRFRNRG